MVVIRPLTEADIPAAQRLREQAGWNQTDEDWRRLRTWNPDGCWTAVTAAQVLSELASRRMVAPRSGEEANGGNLAEQDGQVVGTTAVTSYGQRIAWVGMVLVDVEHRRRGIGRALLTHALAYLDRRGIQTVALDSTPEGQPLYASLGFVDAFELTRWRGPLPDVISTSPSGPSVPMAIGERVDLLPSSAFGGGAGGGGTSGDAVSPVILRPLTAADLKAVTAFDARLFGTERGHILSALQAGHPAGCVLAERAGTIVGYALSRPGARAWHLGPLAADDPTTAEQLAQASIGPLSGAAAFPELVFDAVLPNQHAIALARALGLAPVRRFIRMTRGAPPPTVDLARLYSSAGPELG